MHHPHGFINKWGNTIIDFDSIYGDRFSEGLCSAGLGFNGLMGFVNKRCEFVIPRRYSVAMDFKEGRAFVQENGKWGLIDRMGEYVVEPMFDDWEYFENGLSKVRKDFNYGVIDRFGHYMLEPIYTEVIVLSDRFVCLKGTTFTIIPFKQEDYASSDQEPSLKTFPAQEDALTIVSKWQAGKRGFGFVNQEGQEIIPCIYEEVGYCGNLYKVMDQEGYHLLDGEGKKLTTQAYNYIYDFHEGLCAVEKDLLWGFVNEQGEEVIPPHYHFARDFKDGKCWVIYEGKYCYIDKQGHEVEK